MVRYLHGRLFVGVCGEPWKLFKLVKGIEDSIRRKLAEGHAAAGAVDLEPDDLGGGKGDVDDVCFHGGRVSWISYVCQG